MAEYYVRWRGETSGPFAREQVLHRIKIGTIGKYHEVSTDGVKWVRIADTNAFQDAFRSQVVPRTPAPARVPMDGPRDPDPVEAGSGQDISEPELEMTPQDHVSGQRQPGEDGAPEDNPPEVESGRPRLRIKKRAPDDSAVPHQEQHPTSDGSWHVARDGQREGPFGFGDLQSRVRRGQLDPTDLVWTEGDPDWRQASTVPGLMPTPSASRTVQTSPSGMPHAGFWMRVAAAAIDRFIVQVVICAMVLFFLIAAGLTAWLKPPEALSTGAILVLGAFVLVSLLFPWVYWAFMESSGSQGSLGKIAVGIKVTDIHGKPISFGRALLRQLAKVLSGSLFCAGYIMCAFTEKKQCLHDMVAGTIVVKRRP